MHFGMVVQLHGHAFGDVEDGDSQVRMEMVSINIDGPYSPADVPMKLKIYFW